MTKITFKVYMIKDTALCLLSYAICKATAVFAVVQARGPGGAPLPSWLMFDKTTGIFEGVPSVEDLGENYVTVRAFGQHSHDWAKDVFSVDVTENSRTEPSKGAVPLRGQHHKVRRIDLG